jgi:hypothetical protein
VRRRWLERPPPNLRRRFRANREEAVDSVGSLVGADGVDSPVALIAVVGVLALLVLVVLPLLGVALELVALLFLLGSGLLGRVLLGRPWIVEAVPEGDPEGRVVYAVQGWRRSSRALRELRASVASTGQPETVVGRRLATRPATANA